MKIVVTKGPRGKWVWGFRASNGKLQANNETFPSAGNAQRAAKAVVMAVLRKWQAKPQVEWMRTVEKDGTIVLDFLSKYST